MAMLDHFVAVVASAAVLVTLIVFDVLEMTLCEVITSMRLILDSKHVIRSTFGSIFFALA